MLQFVLAFMNFINIYLYDLIRVNRLELNERMEAVNIGAFLDNYITKDIRINCYAIEKYFVEVFYDAEYKTIPEV